MVKVFGEGGKNWHSLGTISGIKIGFTVNGKLKNRVFIEVSTKGGGGAEKTEGETTEGKLGNHKICFLLKGFKCFFEKLFFSLRTKNTKSDHN